MSLSREQLKSTFIKIRRSVKKLKLNPKQHPVQFHAAFASEKRRSDKD